MTESSEESASFIKSKQGIAIILLVLLLIGAGGYYALGRQKPKPASTNDQSQKVANASDPQSSGSSADQASASSSPSPDPSSSSPTPASASSSPTPTLPPGATPSPTPTLPPPVYADNFSGTWYINFGTMTLTQSGTTVTGTYYNAPQAKSGTISGTVNSQTLTGTWAINGTHGPLSLVKGTHTLSGTYNSSFKWCGALTGYQFPTGCGFAGHWVTKIPSNANCAMDLVRTNNSVSGTYCNGTVVNATVSFPPGDTKLKGTWKIGAVTSGDFASFLSPLSSSPQQLYFQGNYDTSNYWCGGSTAANLPSSCIKT